MELTASVDAVFLYATEGMLVVNEKGRIRHANPSAEKLFGYRKGELIGMQVEQLVPKRLAARHAKHRATYNRNPHARSMGANLELYGVKKNRKEFPVEVSLSPYETAEGRFTIAFIVDISARKEDEQKILNHSAELEKQVRKRTQVLEEAMQELQLARAELKIALDKERELSELKSRFISMASHEFRTPLATILSSVSLIERYMERGDKENQLRHIGKIKAHIRNLTDILNDFLSLSKLEEGKMELVTKEFEIKEFLEDAIREMEPLKKDRQVIQYRHRGSATVNLDPKLFKNILYNLLSNAIKFSSEGSQIKVNSERKDSRLLVIIEDEGIGIPKEDQKHLFERFFRGHNAMNIQGTGLGLNIVMKYLELMKGRLTFTSRENHGTTFKLTFPQ